MKYNGLKSNLNNYAKFIFIYETEIKNISNLSKFIEYFNASYNIFFELKLKNQIKYVKKKEIDDLNGNDNYTLFFTKQKFQIWDLCRHFRNSFVHGSLSLDGDKLIIKDKNHGKLTSDGYLSSKSLKEFIKKVIEEYENKE